MASEKDGSKIFIDYLGLASNLYNFMLDKLIVGMIATSPNRASQATVLRTFGTPPKFPFGGLQIRSER